MLGNQIQLSKNSSQQSLEQPVCESQLSNYKVDCYPYATRGILFGVLLGTGFWSSVITVLILLL